MKERDKSKLTVIILFILMLISIALLIIFIIMAANNLEENQGATSEIQPVIEEQISLNDDSVLENLSTEFYTAKKPSHSSY
ncbi:hypothetical protein [Jeotgalicoccus halotolerans]|uniref:Uncharacterized protein n=1 Tax=Jeotgalicoccus halotolerans TaxID=157227 RepID=A0A3E0AUD1_9STAP|nr:hypothetical protein [Jeotgalicoccus halotolerans]REG23353.1 hypothetical protein DFR63_1719 [Jeotgalicoccus halotolerans]